MIRNFKFKKEIFRLLILLFCVFALSYLSIYFAQLKPINFSIKTGEIPCDKMDDCIAKAKEKSLEILSEQIQTKKAEFKRIIAVLQQFAFIPLEYKIDIKNLSYLKFSVTGTNQEKIIKDIAIDCRIGDKFLNLQNGSSASVFDKLELNDFQEELFDRFDGCNLAPGYVAVKGPFIWPPGEYITFSFERDLQFVPRLIWVSKLLIILQIILMVLIVLPALRQGGLFIKKGKDYFFKN